MKRKLQEVVLALWLEAKFSKDEILQLYLNRVYFGAGATGVEKAAQKFFAKSARDVSLSEAAILAGVLRAPSVLQSDQQPMPPVAGSRRAGTASAWSKPVHHPARSRQRRERTCRRKIVDLSPGDPIYRRLGQRAASRAGQEL